MSLITSVVTFLKTSGSLHVKVAACTSCMCLGTINKGHRTFNAQRDNAFVSRY